MKSNHSGIFIYLKPYFFFFLSLQLFPVVSIPNLPQILAEVQILM